MVAGNPDAFNLRRVSLKAGNGMLCVSTTFGDADGSGARAISLNVATAKPRLDPDALLARLSYGINDNVANFAPYGSIESEPIDGETISGVRERVVELAIPLRNLTVVTTKPNSHPNPRSLTWRLGTITDCIPTPHQLIRYPGGRTFALPANPAREINAISAGGCRGI